MFKKINNAHAISLDGYEVKFDRTYVAYIEKTDSRNKALRFEAEILLNPSSLVIYKSTIHRWFPPYQNEVITQEKKNEIYSRVSGALKFLKVDFRMI